MEASAQPPTTPQAKQRWITLTTASAVGLGSAAVCCAAFVFAGLYALLAALGLAVVETGLCWLVLRPAERAGQPGRRVVLTCLGSGLLIGAVTPSLGLSTVDLALGSATFSRAEAPDRTVLVLLTAASALLGLAYHGLALIPIRGALRHLRAGALDGPSRTARLSGLWLSAVGLLSLGLCLTQWPTLAERPGFVGPAIAPPLLGLTAGVVLALRGARDLRRQARWFERVLEGQEPGWDIRAAEALEPGADKLPPFFVTAPDARAVLVKLTGGQGEEGLVPWARVPWTVPSRVSYPPRDPNAAGPPITTDILRT